MVSYKILFDSCHNVFSAYFSFVGHYTRLKLICYLMVGPTRFELVISSDFQSDVNTEYTRVPYGSPKSNRNSTYPLTADCTTVMLPGILNLVLRDGNDPS